MNRYAFIVLAGLGCSSSTPDANTNANTTTSSGQENTAHTSTLTNSPDAAVEAVPPPPPPPPAPAVTITAGARTDVPTPLPTVRITAPAMNRTLTENRVEVRLNVQHWRNVTDANDHRHIHLILDNNEYIRVDDPTRPTVLENLSEGTHVVRAFPGWMTHESVKTDGAFAMVVFNVGHPTPNFGFNPRAPLLTYSRPKGTMNGADTERVLLDFYLTNVPASDLGPQGVRVRPTIDGHAFEDITAWVPSYIEHLPDGEHTITLDLIGRDGQPLAGPFNHVERHITLNHSAPTEPHAAPAATPTTPATSTPATPPAAPAAPTTPAAHPASAH